MLGVRKGRVPVLKHEEPKIEYKGERPFTGLTWSIDDEGNENVCLADMSYSYIRDSIGKLMRGELGKEKDGLSATRLIEIFNEELNYREKTAKKILQTHWETKRKQTQDNENIYQ
jgi:hypothetical protein